jgi:dihydroorotate dehydrogenase electron transfer subunit
MAIKQHAATVEGNAEPMPGVRLLFLNCPALSASARAGQFVMVRCGEGFDPYLRRALPIHRFTPQGIALCFRPSDPTLAWLGARPLGSVLDILGPCGRGFDLPKTGHISLLAQGLGIVPLLGIADVPHLLDRTTLAVRLIAEVPTPGQVYPRELLPRQVEYLPFVGHDQGAAFGQAVEAACRWAERIYAVGAPTFYRDLRRVCERARLGLRPGFAQVWGEAELVCGMGLCRGCVVRTRQGRKHACLDGPAFDLADMLD